MANAAGPCIQPLEDPLSYLPCSNTVEYRQGEVIFAPGQMSSRLFVLIQGYVKVSRQLANLREVVVDIYRTDEFFGESALARRPHRPEKAVALTKCAVMSWDVADVEALMLQRPMLGVAIAQLLAARDAEFVERIGSLATESAAIRVARTLLRFGARLGERMDDSSTWMPPLTHELIAETIGTSREIVNGQMNELRRLGCLRYSRQGIMLFDNALREWLERRAA